MKQRFLEITYRKGKPVAAYLYLPRQRGDVSTRTEQHGLGLVVDFTADGRAMGVEITAPSRITLADLNQTLKEINQPAATADDLPPLLAHRGSASATA